MCDCPTLVHIYVTAIPYLITYILPSGVSSQYHKDRKLFNINSSCSKFKITNSSIADLQYADGFQLSGHTTQSSRSLFLASVKHMQYLDRLSTSGEINACDTSCLLQPTAPSKMVLCQPERGEPQFPGFFSFREDPNFSMAKLKTWIPDHDIRIQVNLLIYQVAVIPTLFHGCRTWTKLKTTKSFGTFL